MAGEKRIRWDKGHGGTDPGAAAYGLTEKTLNHKIVEYAMAYMMANYTGFIQSVSRAQDQTVSLKERTDAAMAWEADVFVSVHVNAYNGVANGFETFVQPNSMKQSIDLQNDLHSHILTAMRKFDASIEDRGKKSKNLHVLRESKGIPAVLTETLFIDNKENAKHLKNEAFLKAIGEAHAVGVAKYLNLPLKPQKQAPNDEKPTTKPITPAKEKQMYRVKENGVQIGAFGDVDNIADAVKKAIVKSVNKIEIERV